RALRSIGVGAAYGIAASSRPHRCALRTMLAGAVHTSPTRAARASVGSEGGGVREVVGLALGRPRESGPCGPRCTRDWHPAQIRVADISKLGARAFAIGAPRTCAARAVARRPPRVHPRPDANQAPDAPRRAGEVDVATARRCARA